MKAPVLIVLLVTSIFSLGSAAMLLLETRPASTKAVRSPGVEYPQFRWGEGSEASQPLLKAEQER